MPKHVHVVLFNKYYTTFFSCVRLYYNCTFILYLTQRGCYNLRYECVSIALIIQHAMRMRRIVICCLSGCTIFFPHYNINGMSFEKKNKLLNIKCVFWFPIQIWCKIFLILRRIQRYIIMNVDTSCQLFLSDCNQIRIFRDRFSKVPQIWNFMKIYPVGNEMFHADGRTDTHDKANRRFWYFTKASKIDFLFHFLPVTGPGVAQRPPGGLGSQITMTFGTWRW